jgi:hypothetical protein
MAFVAAAALYYFLLHLFLPEVLQVPHRLAIPRLNTEGLFRRRITRASGALLTIFLSISGVAIWFALFLAPIMMFKEHLYPVASVKFWCFAPMVLGMVVRRLVSATRAA